MLLNRLYSCFCMKYWEEFLMNISLKFPKKSVLFLILLVRNCQTMEKHSMLPSFELQFLTGFSCWLNGIFLFKTIFPIFSIVWWHKGRIVGRKVQGQNNEQDIQKRLLSLKACHHSLPESWSAETSKGDEARRLKILLLPSAPAPHLCLCLSLDFVLHCLKAWEFASYQCKWPHLVIKFYSAPYVAKPGSDYFCALMLCHLCTLPVAGRPVWFSPLHCGC